jgi:hypothetical protein
MSALTQLTDLDQSICYDDSRRALLDRGELVDLLDRFTVTGVTPDPTIFENAIAGGSDDDEGLLHALGEGVEGSELLQATELDIDLPATLEVWRHGSVVRSWLLDLFAAAVAADPALTSVAGWAQDSGEGRWTVEQALELAVPAPAITAALFARFASRQDDAPAMKAIAVMRNAFGGHEVRS